jgi:CDP-paratose 2-epimerase
MAFLVTGGCGFVGSNISAELVRRGERVLILDNLSRAGSDRNLEWLKRHGEIEFFNQDVRSMAELESLFRSNQVNCVFHLAGQVAMTTSLASPQLDFEINVVGTMNVLECVRKFAPDSTVVYASSNKVYGDLEDLELVEMPTRYEPKGRKVIDERAPLQFCTPYGCSKGAADQYVLEYARNFGVNSVVFRHSTIYGGRQISTFDQGWVGWFCRKALDTLEDPATSFTINGNGRQVRDLLHVSDAVLCYLAAHEHVTDARGQVFNIGGGYENSMSLLELFDHLEGVLGIKMNPHELPWRANDQKYFVADCTKVAKYLNWTPQLKKARGIADALTWEQTQRQSGGGK